MARALKTFPARSWLLNFPRQVSAAFKVTGAPGKVETRPTLLNPVFANGTFKFALATLVGKTYTVQYKNSFSDPVWTTLRVITGTGSTVQVLDAAAAPTSRFYRTRVDNDVTQPAPAPFLLADNGLALVTEKNQLLAAL